MQNIRRETYTVINRIVLNKGGTAIYSSLVSFSQGTFFVSQETVSISCETNPPGDAHAAQRKADFL
ncbi:MAG TPA: hypothetical protein DCM49_05380 [Lachnospiraceae bacterium]|nr:hypothetical protein [Lachnospiraceae bacterium]